MNNSVHISFVNQLSAFAPITLAEMESIKLMNRIDSKFLTDEFHLQKVLEAAARAGYRALETENQRISPYNSVYYDTISLRMFSDHHNKRLVRQKVRTREYVNSGDVFLEIKRKNNKGRTSKKRISIPKEELMDFSLDKHACDYLAEKSWFHVEELTPILQTLFSRITLVNPTKTERLTIDTNLVFNNFRTGESATLYDAVIIELKQDGHLNSQMKNILLDYRVKPMRISKYCIAVTLTDSTARSGRFKLKVRTIEKTINKKITIDNGIITNNGQL